MRRSKNVSTSVPNRCLISENGDRFARGCLEDIKPDIRRHQPGRTVIQEWSLNNKFRNLEDWLDTEMERRPMPPRVNSDQSRILEISGTQLTTMQVAAVARDSFPVQLSKEPDIRKKILASRAPLEEKLRRGEIMYGVNTGTSAARKKRPRSCETGGF
jgi:Aromatic amino acid lyase